MTTITTSRTDIRSRREQLGLSRLALAVRAGITPTWMAALEAGLPTRGPALTRVLAVLDELERRFVPFAEVSDHLELGRDASDGPKPLQAA